MTRREFAALAVGLLGLKDVTWADAEEVRIYSAKELPTSYQIGFDMGKEPDQQYQWHLIPTQPEEDLPWSSVEITLIERRFMSAYFRMNEKFWTLSDRVHHSREQNGIVLDFNANDDIVGVEILDFVRIKEFIRTVAPDKCDEFVSRIMAEIGPIITAEQVPTVPSFERPNRTIRAYFGLDRG